MSEINFGYYSLDGFTEDLMVPKDLAVPYLEGWMGAVVRVKNKTTATELQRLLFNYVVVEDKEIVTSIRMQGINVILVTNEEGDDPSLEDIIEDNRLFTVFVVGSPRTGTSLLTHIVELLGVSMVYDSEKKMSNLVDNDPNPTGFYEITRDFMGHYLQIWAHPYSGCKMIAPIRDFRLEVMKRYPSKIIWSLRDVDAMLKSQTATFGHPWPLRDKEQTLIYLTEQGILFETNRIPVLEVYFEDVLGDTEKTMYRIKDFIGSREDIQEAVDFIDPSLSKWSGKEEEKEKECGWDYCRGTDYGGFPHCKEHCENEED